MPTNLLYLQRWIQLDGNRLASKFHPDCERVRSNLFPRGTSRYGSNAVWNGDRYWRVAFVSVDVCVDSYANNGASVVGIIPNQIWTTLISGHAVDEGRTKIVVLYRDQGPVGSEN